MLEELGIGSTLRGRYHAGLTRSVDYKANLMAADGQQAADLDGRETLARNLIAFCENFVRVFCLKPRCDSWNRCSRRPLRLIAFSIR